MGDSWKAESLVWTLARFHSCRFDRARRELRCDGQPRSLEPKAFDLLVYLIEQRHRVVPKGDLLTHCLGNPTASEGALARSVMKVRQAIGDFDVNHPLIKTVHGVGYRFVADLQLSDAPDDEPVLDVDDTSPEDADAAARRVVVLPFKNDTSDAELAWVELGLMSLAGKAFRTAPDVSIVPAHDVLAALGRLSPQSSIEERVAAVAASLNVHTIVSGRLSGGHGRYLLDFDLRTPELGVMHGIVAGSDAARMAVDAAMRMREWLVPDDTDAAGTGLDLGDEFLNEAFALALQRSRQNRLIEAEHLFDVVCAAAPVTPDVQYESTRVQVQLGRPRAAQELQALEQDAISSASPFLQAMAGALRGLHFEQQGRMSDAATAMLRALEVAEKNGLSDLAVQLMLDAAHYLGGCFDPRAHPLLSRALPRAERLGNRVLVSEAYWVAGKLAGFSNDWISAARHHEMAVSVARDMDDAVQFAPSSILAWTQAQLGQLDIAIDSALDAFRVAQSSGRQPELALTAGTALHLCLADRRVRQALQVFEGMRAMEGDRSAAMVLARQVHFRAPLLSVAGLHDDALACIAEATEVTRGNPVLLARCGQAQLAVLLRARRFDALRDACESMRDAAPGTLDPRLAPWVDRALALRMCFGEGDVAAGLERLHHLVQATPMCEAHATVALEAAWLHLEQGQVEPARKLAAHLRNSLEQTPSGLLLDARLRHATGDSVGAMQRQQGFLRRHSDTATPFHHELLQIYERGVQDAAIPLLGESVELHWRISAELLASAMPMLGQMRASTAPPMAL